MQIPICNKQFEALGRGGQNAERKKRQIYSYNSLSYSEITDDLGHHNHETLKVSSNNVDILCNDLGYHSHEILKVPSNNVDTLYGDLGHYIHETLKVSSNSVDTLCGDL